MTKWSSVEAYQAAFVLKGPGWDGRDSERALLQLGMPTSHSVVLWFVGRLAEPARLELLAIRPAVEVVERREQLDDQSPLRLELSGLRPGTRYELDVCFAERGETQKRTLHASTAPAAGERAAFSFLATSCFQPYAGGRHGLSVTEETVQSLELYRLRSSGTFAAPPAFSLGLGDQIYVDDGSRSLLCGWSSQECLYPRGQGASFFETIYRSTFSLEPLDASLRALPSAMMWDDHEIRDGWGSHGDEEDEKWREHLSAARRHFVSWQALRNPKPRDAERLANDLRSTAEPGRRLTDSPNLDFEFDWSASATFFVMDLRSSRAWNEERVISPSQYARFEEWLARPRSSPSVYVLCSPIPLTQVRMLAEWIQAVLPMRRDDLRDCWWHPRSRNQRDRILLHLAQFFRQHRQHRLLILSGDVHMSEVLELSDAEGVFGHEIISSGLALASFFPFLRGKSQAKTRLTDSVSARGLGRFLGPSFAEIHVTPGEPAMRLSVSFHAAVTEGRKYLSKLPAGPAPRLELPLSCLNSKGRLFAPFSERASSSVRPTASATGFR